MAAPTPPRHADTPPWSAADSLGHSVSNRLARPGLAQARMGVAIGGSAGAIHDRHASFLAGLAVRPPGLDTEQAGRWPDSVRIFRSGLPRGAVVRATVPPSVLPRRAAAVRAEASPPARLPMGTAPRSGDVPAADMPAADLALAADGAATGATAATPSPNAAKPGAVATVAGRVTPAPAPSILTPSTARGLAPAAESTEAARSSGSAGPAARAAAPSAAQRAQTPIGSNLPALVQRSGRPSGPGKAPRHAAVATTGAPAGPQADAAVGSSSTAPVASTAEPVQADRAAVPNAPVASSSGASRASLPVRVGLQVPGGAARAGGDLVHRQTIAPAWRAEPTGVDAAAPTLPGAMPGGARAAARSGLVPGQQGGVAAGAGAGRGPVPPQQAHTDDRASNTAADAQTTPAQAAAAPALGALAGTLPPPAQAAALTGHRGANALSPAAPTETGRAEARADAGPMPLVSRAAGAVRIDPAAARATSTPSATPAAAPVQLSVPPGTSTRDPDAPGLPAPGQAGATTRSTGRSAAPPASTTPLPAAAAGDGPRIAHVERGPQPGTPMPAGAISVPSIEALLPSSRAAATTSGPVAHTLARAPFHGPGELPVARARRPNAAGSYETVPDRAAPSAAASDPTNTALPAGQTGAAALPASAGWPVATSASAALHLRAAAGTAPTPATPDTTAGEPVEGSTTALTPASADSPAPADMPLRQPFGAGHPRATMSTRGPAAGALAAFSSEPAAGGSGAPFSGTARLPTPAAGPQQAWRRTDAPGDPLSLSQPSPGVAPLQNLAFAMPVRRGPGPASTALRMAASGEAERRDQGTAPALAREAGRGATEANVLTAAVPVLSSGPATGPRGMLLAVLSPSDAPLPARRPAPPTVHMSSPMSLPVPLPLAATHTTPPDWHAAAPGDDRGAGANPLTLIDLSGVHGAAATVGRVADDPGARPPAMSGWRDAAVSDVLPLARGARGRSLQRIAAASGRGPTPPAGPGPAPRARPDMPLVLARQESPPAAPYELASPAPGSAASHGHQAGEAPAGSAQRGDARDADTDLEELVERAWRAVMSRLATEQERRGYGRWA